MANLSEISVNDVQTRRGGKGVLTTSYVAIHAVGANSAPEVVDVILGSIDAGTAGTVDLVLAATGEDSSTGTTLAIDMAVAATTVARLSGIPMNAGDTLYAKNGAADDIAYVVSTQKERTGESAH